MDKLMMVEKELKENLKRDYPEFDIGDIIKVYYKIMERGKERFHPVEGVVIRTQGAMHRKTFTVRRMAYGQAYEVTFPFYSPKIHKVEVIKKSSRRPRRAKLYYIRNRIGKKAVVA